MCQALLGADNTTYDQRPTLMAWNQMIDAYFRAGMPVIAIELVAVMISSSLYRLLVIVGDEHSSARLVNVHEGSVIQETLLEQQHSPGKDALSQGQLPHAVRPEAVAWSVMIESLASHGMIDKPNDAFERTLTGGTNDSVAPTFMQRKLMFLVDTMHVNNDIRKRSAMVRAVWEESLSRGLVDFGAEVMLDCAETLVYLVWQRAITSAVPALSTRIYCVFGQALKHKPTVADDHMHYVLHSRSFLRSRSLALTESFPLIQDAGLSLSSINSFDKEFIGRNIKVQLPFAVELSFIRTVSHDEMEEFQQT
ncbi:hypothetical protein JOM56_007046 [Amanita muscaria]